MYVGQIILRKQAPSEPDAVSDSVNHLLSALRMNGQICGREFPIAVMPDGYTITVLLPEETSLEASHHNRYVHVAMEKLREIGLSEPEVKVAEDLDGAGACGCEQPSSYILYTTFVSLEAPLRCGDCFSPVPLYRIPPTKHDEYYDIISWQSDYQACDTLHMNCSSIQRTALRQLSRLDSGLSEQGLTVCRRIQDLTRTPVFYYLYTHYGRSLGREKERRCPSCQGDWLLPEPWHLFDFKCDRCRLVSNIAWSVQ